jgi:hypothetical protein
VSIPESILTLLAVLWLPASLALGILVGRGIALADAKERHPAPTTIPQTWREKEPAR